MRQGAGRMPTASAVVADMIDVAVGRTPITFRTLELWSDRESKVSLVPFDDLPGRYYMRFEVLDKPGVMAQITSILGQENLSIASIIQHEPDPDISSTEAQPVKLVIMTHEAPEGAARTAVERISRLQVVTGQAVRMRVLASPRKNKQ
jgi:homoserine dehydrogenase